MEPIKQVVGIDVSIDTFVSKVGTIAIDQQTEIGTHNAQQIGEKVILNPNVLIYFMFSFIGL